MKYSRFRSAVFLQFMGTVGSGIFVLPFLFSQSNFIFASIFLIFLTVITGFLNHFYVEIVSATEGDHQLSGYAQIYLGGKFKLVTSLNLMLLAFGAIIAYSKLFTNFTALLFPSLSVFTISGIFLFSVFLLFFFRQNLSRNVFLFIPIFMLFIPIFLFIYSLIPISEAGVLKLAAYPSFSFYGPLLFALSGFTIVPEVQETLGTNKKLSLVVFLGLFLAAITYFLYSFSIIKLSGQTLSIDSVTGMALVHPVLSKIIAGFGMVVTLRASFGFMIILRELFYRDLKIPLSISNYLPLLFPLAALFLKSVSLLTIISLTGHITIFISALIICLIRSKLPQTITTQFFIILIIISLSLGLWF